MDIDEECSRLYEDLSAIQDLLNLSRADLIRKAFYKSERSESELDDEKEAQKFFDKHNKTLSRKNWIKDKGKRKVRVKPDTLRNLKELYTCVIKLDEYQKKKTKTLRVSELKQIKRIAKKASSNLQWDTGEN
jgi:hypothetical protein